MEGSAALHLFFYCAFFFFSSISCSLNISSRYCAASMNSIFSDAFCMSLRVRSMLFSSCYTFMNSTMGSHAIAGFSVYSSYVPILLPPSFFSMVAINSELDKTKEDFIKHFKTSYSDPYPPSWMIAEILPFGNLRYIYDNLKSSSLKKQIAQYFGLEPRVFFSWLIVLGGLRNICCHHSRAWNRILPVITQNPQKTSFGWIDITQTDNRRMYYRLCMIKYLLFTISPNNTFKYKLKDLIAAYPTIDIKAMGFPENWDNEPVWR